MALTRPVIIPPWAETGDKSTQPSDSDIQEGWPLTSTPPSRQKFNWLLNFLANGVRYLTSRGIADWDSGETYAKNSVCIGDDGRLYQSIQASNLNNIPSTSTSYWARVGDPVGSTKFHTGSTAPYDWVEENGGTIGNAASGATTRANADTAALFAHLWNTYSNSVLIIQDSSGSPTTRGASAAADFAANKRMPLFDMRGEFARGWDNSRGVDSGRALGSAQGSENLSHDHTGSTSSTGSHTHTGTTDSGGDHSHTVDSSAGLGTSTGGSNTVQQNSGSMTTSTAGAHTHSFTTGSGGTHSHSFTTNAAGVSESRPRNLARLAIIKL